jgi:putative flavoprotein involved in K+ transport
MHHRWIVATEPGLYFVGLFFLYAMSSGFLRGVGRDAEHVVKDIASRARGDRSPGHGGPTGTRAVHPIPADDDDLRSDVGRR